jgi:hypothetical protein
VRKGLEGREAVAPRKKSMQSMGFFSWRDGTPAKPGFLRSRLPGFSFPEGEPRGSRLVAAKFASTAGGGATVDGGAKNAPKLFHCATRYSLLNFIMLYCRYASV